MGGVATSRHPATNAVHVRHRHRIVMIHAEHQRDVDINSRRQNIGDGGDSFGGGWHFNHQVGTVDGGKQPFGFDNRASGVTGEIGGNFKADKPIALIGLRVQGGEDVASGLNISDSHRFVCVHRPRAVGDELAQLHVIIVALADGLFKNRRIGSHAAQPIAVD